MSRLRLSRKWTAAIASAALVVPALAITSSTALLTSANSALAANTVSTQSCSSSAWDTQIGSYATAGTLTGWQKFGTLVSGSTNKFVNSGGTVTGDYSGVPTAAGNQGQTGALYCSSDPALGFVATNDKVDSPSATVTNWGLTSGPNTLLLWFKGTATAAGTLAGFEVGGPGGTSDRVLWVDASGNLKFSWYNGTASTTIGSSGTAYNDGMWHLAAVAMGVASSGTAGATLYVDGNQAATSSTGTYDLAASGGSNAKWRIGDVDKTTVTGPTYSTWLGTVDEWVLIHGALTPTQLAAASTSRSIAGATITPPTGSGTASVGTQKALTSASLTAASANVTGASIKPNAAITSATITPNKSISGLTVTPEQAISSASVNAAPTLGATSILPQKAISALTALPQMAISGSITPQKAISSFSTSPRSTISSATISPNTSITASLSPSRGISGLTVSPEQSISSATINASPTLSTTSITPQKAISSLTTTPQATISGSITPQKAISSLTTSPRSTISSAVIAPNATISSASIAPHKGISSASVLPEKAIASASVTPVPTVTGSVTPEQGISSVSADPVKSITSASITPNTTISSASISPTKALAGLSLTPRRSITSATVSPAPVISSTNAQPVQTIAGSILPNTSITRGTASGAASQTITQLAVPTVQGSSYTAAYDAVSNTTTVSITIANTTTVNATAARCKQPLNNNVDCQTGTSQYASGDWIYVDFASGITDGWYQSATTANNIIKVTLTGDYHTSATQTQSVMMYGRNVLAKVTSATGYDTGLVGISGTNATIDSPAGVGYSTVGTPFWNTTTYSTSLWFAFTLDKSLGLPSTTVSNSPGTATAAKWATSIVYTTSTAHQYQVGDRVTVTSFGSPNTALNVSSTAITAVTTSSPYTFTVTGNFNVGNTDVNPVVASGTVPLTRIGITTSATHIYVATDQVTLNVPNSVTNYDQLNGKVCTVQANSASTPLTSTGFWCTVTTAPTANVAFTSSDSATTSFTQNSVTITTSAAHGLVVGNIVTFTVPSTVTNYTQLNGKTCTLTAVPDTTSFTCTPSSGITANVALTAANRAFASVEKAISATTISPASTVTAATVTTSQQSISSSTIQTTSAVTKITISGTTALKFAATAPVGSTYGSAAGWKIGDFVYISGVSCATALNTNNKCQSGYDTALNGGWYAISAVNGTSDITVTLGTTIATYFAYCTGAGGCTATLGTAKSTVITTAAVHGLLANDSVVVNGASSSSAVPNGTYTVVSAPTTSTLTLNPGSATGWGAPVALTAAGTITKPVTSAVFTAANTYTLADNPTVTVTGLVGTGASTVNVTSAAITARDANTFTATIPAYAGPSISLTSQSGTATANQSNLTLTTSVNSGFKANDVLTLAVPSTVTNYDQLNGKTCTIGGTDPSGTSVTCALSTPATKNVAISSTSAGATVSSKSSATVTISTAAGTAYSPSDQVTLSVPSSVANYGQLDGKTCTVAASPAPTTTSFTCTLPSAVLSNVTVASGDGATSTLPTSSVAVTLDSSVAFTYSSGDQVTLYAPSTVANYALIDGKTCTVQASPAPTSTTFSCNLAASASTNVSATSTADGATLTSPLSTVLVTTATAHGYTTGTTVAIDTADNTLDTASASVTVTSPTTFTYQLASPYNGQSITTTGTSTLGKTLITVTTSTPHGYADGATATLTTPDSTVNSAGTNATITVTSPTTFTIPIASYTGPNIDVTGSVNGPVSYISVTSSAAHGYSVGAAPYLWVPSSITNYGQLDGKTCTLTSVDSSTSFTCTLSSPVTAAVSAGSSDGASMSTGVTSVALTTTSTQSFAAGNRVTLSVPSSVTHYDQLNGKTCTIAASPAPTSTTFTCSLSSPALRNVTLASGSGATASTVTGFTATVAPTSATITAIGVDPQKSISSATPRIINLTKIDLPSGTTVKFTSGTAHGFVVGDWVFINIPAYSSTTAQGWHQITAVGSTTDFTFAVANTTNLPGGGAGSFTLAANTTYAYSDSVTVTTTSPHGFAAAGSAVIAGVSSVLNGTYTIASVPTTTTFTYTLPHTGTSIPAAVSSAGTATSNSTLVTVTAANSFANGNTVTIQDTGKSALDGSYTVANATASSFTYTLASAQSSATSAATGTAAIAVTSVAVTTSTPQLLAAGAVPVLNVPSSVTNYAELNGKPCTVAASPVPTTSGFTCTLATAATRPITLTSGSGADFGIARTDLSVTMAAAHTYTANQVLTLVVPTTVANYAQVNGKTCTVQSGTITSTGFTCTLSSGAIQNVAIAAGDSASISVPTTLFSATTSTPHGFTSADTVTLEVPSSVTNYDQLNGKTCAITLYTSTTFTCTISSSVSKNVTLDGLGATALKPLSTVTVAAPNTYLAGQSVTVTTNNATIDGTFTIATADANGFTYAIPSYSGVNIDVSGVAQVTQTLVTVTTSAAHTFTTGDTAVISTGVTAIDGSRSITVTGSTTFTFTIPSYTGANISAGGTATVGKTAMSITTTAANNFAVGNAVTLEVPSSVTNYDQLDGKTCTVTATGTTFTCTLSSAATQNVSVSSSDNADALYALTSLSVTTAAAHPYAVGNSATLSVPSSVTNYDQLDGKTCSVTAIGASSFTCTVSSSVTKNVTLGGSAATGTATVTQGTLSITTTAANTFAVGNALQLDVPSTVTNYDQLNGKTCTVATTGTTFTCTLSSPAAKNVAITSSDSSYATLGLSTLAVTTTAAHVFKAGNTIVLQVPSSVANYTTLDGKTCLVLASPTITSTTFSCTLSSAAMKNVSILSTDGAVATPDKSISTASLSPATASIATASVTPSTTVTRGAIARTTATVTGLSHVTGAITAILTNGTTSVKTSINCKAVTGNNECGTAGYGFDTGDWLYVTLASYPALSGWRQIGTTGNGFVNLIQSSATTINANASVTTSGTAEQATMTATTATAHGLAAGDKVNMAVNNAAIDATGYSVVAAPTTTTFTFVLDRTLGGPSNTVSNTPTTATMTRWASTATFTAANTYVAGRDVTVSGFSDAALNGTFAIASATSSSFTVTLAAAVNANHDESPASGTGLSGIDTVALTTWTTSTFVAGDVITLFVPSSVDPNGELNAKTCTVLASPAPTSSSLSCTLPAQVLGNVSVGITDGATAGKGTSSLTISTGVAHGFTVGQQVKIRVPSSVTNYDQLNGQGCTVSVVVSTTSFTCTLVTPVTKSIDLAGGGATVALPVTSFAVTTAAAHGYAVGAVVYVWVPSSVANYTGINGQSCTVATVPTTTSFTCTLSLGTARNITIGSSDGATVALPATTLAVTTSSAHYLASTNVVTMQVPSTVPNYDQLNGKTCTVLASPAITSTTFSCTLTSGVARNLALTGASGASAKYAATVVTVNAPSHGLANGSTTTISTGNSLFNGSKTITVLDANTFTYTVPSYSAANVSASGTAVTAQTVVTVTTSAAHTYTTGDTAVISTGDATIDGSRVITVTSPTTFTFAIPAYSGANISATGNATVNKTSMSITTTAANGFAVGTAVTLEVPSSVTNYDQVNGKTCTVTATGTTFTCTLSSAATQNVSISGSDNADALFALSSLTVTTDAVHPYVAGNVATLAVPNTVANYDQLDGKTCTVTAVPTTTSYTCTLSSAATKNVTIGGSAATGTSTINLTSLSVTTTGANGFVAGNAVTLEVPSSVTNYDQLAGKTCTVTTAGTTFVCTLSSAATKNVTLASGDSAYATLGLSTLAVTTTAAHSFTSGSSIVLQVPSSVANYDQLNGKTCTVLASPTITATTFSCTLSSAATKNVSILSTDGAVATPEKSISTGSLAPPTAQIASTAVAPVTTVTRGQYGTTSATVSSLSHVTGAITALQTSSTATVKFSINCKTAPPAVSGKECGTAGYGFDTGDWLYITLAGYPDLSGWKQISATANGKVTVSLAATTTINGDSALSISGTAEQALITATTATAHGLAAADTVNLVGLSSILDGTGIAVATAPTTTTFTFVMNHTLGVPSDTLSNSPSTATMTRWATTVTYTADNSYTAGRDVTVAGFDDATFNGTFTIASATPTSFTYTLATPLNASGDESPSAASALSAVDQVSMTTWTTHSFVAGDVLTLSVPSSVDPDQVLGGQTCTVQAGTVARPLNANALTCTLATPALENVTVGINDGATATKGLTSLTLATGVAHGFTVGQQLKIRVPSSVTNYEQIDNQPCTVTAVASTTSFTCTLATSVLKSIDLAGGGATVALPVLGLTITTAAAHGYTSGKVVYVWVPSSVPNASGVNGQTCTVLSSGLTTTQFTCTLSSGLVRNLSIGSSDGATVALPATTLAITTGVTHGFVSGNVVTMVVPSSVTNYTQLNNKTCTVLKTPAPTATTFSCTLTSGVARNIALTGSSSAFAKFGQTTVTVTAPGHGYVSNALATITTGNPVLDGTGKKITVVDANTFTYTVTSYSGANITATGTALVPQTKVTLTVPAHGMANGDMATITTDQSTLNGQYAITKVDANTLTYTISAYSGANITSATGTAIVWSDIVNVSATAHGLVKSQKVVLTGTGVPEFDGQVCTLANVVPATDSFACTLATSYGTTKTSSTGYVNTYGTTATITSPNGLSVGDTVYVSGAGAPFDSPSGATVTAATSSSFSYAVPSTLYTSASSSWVSPAKTMALTTSSAHGLAVGDIVTIANSGAAFNGTYPVTAVPSATTVTLGLGTPTTTGSSTSTGDYWAGSLYLSAGFGDGSLAVSGGRLAA